MSAVSIEEVRRYFLEREEAQEAILAEIATLSRNVTESQIFELLSSVRTLALERNDDETMRFYEGLNDLHVHFLTGSALNTPSEEGSVVSLEALDMDKLPSAVALIILGFVEWLGKHIV